jgi:hypothetical protein
MRIGALLFVLVFMGLAGFGIMVMIAVTLCLAMVMGFP